MPPSSTCSLSIILGSRSSFSTLNTGLAKGISPADSRTSSRRLACTAAVKASSSKRSTSTELSPSVDRSSSVLWLDVISSSTDIGNGGGDGRASAASMSSSRSSLSVNVKHESTLSLSLSTRCFHIAGCTTPFSSSKPGPLGSIGNRLPAPACHLYPSKTSVKSRTFRVSAAAQCTAIRNASFDAAPPSCLTSV